jgi:hypothetical protein
MATNYSPTIVTDGAVFVGDALMPSISERGTRLYNRAGVDSADVKLLIHGNVGSGQSFTDSSLSNHAITANGDVTHSTTQSKFSGGSIKFDGTGDYLDVADSTDWEFGNGIFTIDFWFKNNSTATSRGVISITNSSVASNYESILVYTAGSGTNLVFYSSSNNTWDIASGAAMGAFGSGWTHYAIVRESVAGNIKLYNNGTLQTTVSTSATLRAVDKFYIGQRAFSGATVGASCYLDEIRITKGTALWTQDFTPPTRRNTLSISDGMMYAGTCLDFDGTDDRADISDASSLATSFGTTISCSVWVKSSQINTYKYLVDFDGTTDRWIFGWNTSSSGQIGYFNGTWRNFGTNPAADGSWHHLVLVVTASKQRLYIDGVQFGSELSSATSAMDGNGTTMYAPRGGFDGETADLRLYNVELSLAQIKEIYNNSKVILPANTGISNLKLWWPYGEGAGTTCFDGSGNGHNGTSTNDSSYLTGQTGAPQLITGYNRPLKFASGDYVNVPVVGGSTGPLAIGTNDFTVCGWWYGDPSQTQGPNLFMQFSGAGGFRLVATSSPAYRFTIFDNGWTNYAYKDVNVTLGTWQHIAVSCDRDGTAVCYLNGSASGSALDISSVTGSLTNSDPLRIGNGNYTNTTPSSDWTYGVINECMIFNGIALNATDIAALAATDAAGAPLPPDPRTMSFNTSGYSTSHLKGYWRNTGNSTWTDDSGNSNTGTVYGGSKDTLTFREGYNGNKNVNTGRDHQGFPLFHKNVGAIGFISDSYITVPSLGTSGEFSNCTISIWFNKQNQIDTYGNLFDCNFDITDYNKGPRMEIHTDNSTIRLYLAADNGNYYSAPAGTFSNDIWTNITWKITTIGTSKQIVTPYINGVNSYEATEQTNSSYFWDGDIGALNIGRGFSSARTFTGDIGNFRIYNRGLSAAEILQNYNAQKSRFT